MGRWRPETLLPPTLWRDDDHSAGLCHDRGPSDQQKRSNREGRQGRVAQWVADLIGVSPAEPGQEKRIRRLPVSQTSGYETIEGDAPAADEVTVQQYARAYL